MIAGHLAAPRRAGPWVGLAVSDLHLFRYRSRGEAVARQARERAGSGDFLVLNGDIFDFRWADRPDLPDVCAAEAAAVAWLAQFCAAVAPTLVLYVLGNHDGHAEFRHRLARDAAGIPNLRWFQAFVRVGSALFLHGDLPLTFPRRTPLERPPGRRPWRRGKAMRLWNMGIVYPFFGVLAPLVFPAAHASRRVFQVLRRHAPGVLPRVRDLCFGHIHHPFTDLTVGPRRVHNSGAPLPGFRWKMVRVETAEGDWEGW